MTDADEEDEIHDVESPRDRLIHSRHSQTQPDLTNVDSYREYEKKRKNTCDVVEVLAGFSYRSKEHSVPERRFGC